MKRVLLLDLCGTIYNSNTTFDFLDFYLKGNKRLFVKLLRSSLLLRVINKISFKLLSLDAIRALAIMAIKDEPRQKLLLAADDFLDGLPLMDNVLAEINFRKDSFDKIYLISASLDFIVEAASIKFHFDGFYSSKLSYERDICTGRLVEDLLLTKSDVINNEFSKNCYLSFITDNLTDYPCANHVDEFVPVIKDGDVKSHAFWLDKGFKNVIVS